MSDPKIPTLRKVVFSVTAFEDGELKLGGNLENKGGCLFIVAETIKAILSYKPQKIVKASVIPKIKQRH